MRKICLLALSICLGTTLFAQTGVWTLVPNATVNPEVFQNHYKPAVFKTFRVDEQSIRNTVASAPLEGTVAVTASPVIISIPNAEGVLERFRVVNSPVMQQGLADKFPMIQTYLGYGIDHPGSTARFDLTTKGFNAAIYSADRKTIYVNAVDIANGYCVVFDRDGMSMVPGHFQCTTEAARSSISADPIVTSADDGQRRTYRLAVTVNGEFSLACLTGSEINDAQKKASVMSVLTTDLNRANGIYDKEFGIRMNYVTGMDALIYLDPSTDPYATSTGNWNNNCKTVMTAFGSANFDIGHLVGKVSAANANGNAGCIACVCSNASGTYKGSGFTAHNTVQGDPLVVDYWTHEMGHQFGANHTFTFNDEGSGVNMEPGSGTTIMGYAGITGATDVQPHSDDYFHAGSIAQITTYIKSGAGATCAVSTPTGNAAPTANAGADYKIPKSTPFMLTGQGSDANGADVLSYTWEQFDDYGTGSNTYPAATSTSGPVFRSRTYSSSPVRIFPQIDDIISGANGGAWEVLPSVARALNFRLTVRDNSALGGSNQFDDMIVTVDAASGPFAVSSPNSFTTWRVGEYQTITWDVAGSNAGNINCANVAIELSTDGGYTYPVTLVASTPNDGSQEIIVPNNITSQARIRVRAIGNIFFDISNANFTIQAPASGDFSFNSPDPVNACAGSGLTTTLNTASLAGYSTAINLNGNVVPAGPTVVFGSGSVTPGNGVTVSLQGAVPAGTYTVTVSGTSGSLNHSKNITFIVANPAGTPTLSAPASAATGIGLLPTFSWNAASGAGSYTLEYSTNASLSSGVTTVTGISGTSYTPAASLNQNTHYYWRVKAVNACGPTNSVIGDFTTAAISCGNVTSSDVPKTISTSGTPNVSSTLTVASGGVINDVDVIGLVGTHSWINDLTVKLYSPAFTSITLWDRICDDENNFNLNLDDAAAITTFPCPPTGGLTIKPTGSLASFNGQNSTGTWTLTIKDNVDQDGGSLTGWGLKICINSTSLPVSWLNFTAKRNGERAVLVEWSTATEVNNKQFEVERSRDAVNFETIGTIAAGTNPNSVQQYLYNDMNPYAGVSYYRLKQVDKDGKFKYSGVARVTINQDKSVYSISPNPASTKTVLNVYKDMKQVSVKLVDISGKTVYTVSKPVIKAGETMSIPVSGFAKGYYMVIIESANGRYTEKLIVQ